jgi:CRISPR-associated protein Csx3
MTTAEVVWIYRVGARVIELRARCSTRVPASSLQVRVLSGEPCEFLVTNRLCIGATEESVPAKVTFDATRGSAVVVSEAAGVSFALGVDPALLAAVGGNRLVQADAPASEASYAVFVTKAVTQFALVMSGCEGGAERVNGLLDAARAELDADTIPQPMPTECPVLACPANAAAARVGEILPWFGHDAWIHFSAPHGLEQSGGGAWGVRDVCQGSIEWLLATGRNEAARSVLCTVFRQQYVQDGDWPQWFMLAPDEHIRQLDSHGDVILWPLKALCLYVERSGDTSILSARLPYTDVKTLRPTSVHETVQAHCDRIVQRLVERSVPGTALVDYGHGDWDDTLQPADPALRKRMVSAWTVALACQTLELFAGICRRVGETSRAQRVTDLATAMRADFRKLLMVDGIVAGFLIRGDSGDTLLLHPRDNSTGIHFRLIPMTRAILAGIFTPEEARRHMELIRENLLFPDGVRLMSTPVPYTGGGQRFFKRAETAANVGREIGLMYVHAHLRYAEALAHLGDGEALWNALQLVNPVGLAEVLPQAVGRQSNVFFSSSDADFADRYEAARRWEELRAGKVAVRGGWRLYSSGPGLFINLVRSGLLGIRESFGDVVFDPVLPRSLDGLTSRMRLLGRNVEVRYIVRGGGVRSVSINGVAIVDPQRDPNPYRPGGLRVSAERLRSLLSGKDNHITIEL